ncbi:hypothetical protein B0A50_03810 [Salinomyces thailandicus]|uniref:S-adenosyl-L-methionine-dependent methyltransferase n=1 Tax=Salinomyces thailandicus TaxID=706561 RepID=A0A4U0U0D1_9PEZI|nr:hypothetical protein B0A50_03810 [Salinomyces thailandica]
MGFYIVGLYTSITTGNHRKVTDLAEQKDVASRYDDTADSFDSEVGVTELLMGINGIRQKLAARCKGHVLEVSCGTGRNLGYYDIGKDGKVDSLCFVDLSPQMVEVCRKKWAALFGSEKASSKLKPTLNVRFVTGSALSNMPLAPNDKKYDTIIQTMGLCSTPCPVQLLTNMVTHLNTSNPEARILLLEHGRSYMPWLNSWIDVSAQAHAEKHGCWANRDIGALVQEAADQSGLEVMNERRHHAGTTWMFELKAKPEIANTQAAVPTVTTPEPAESKSWLSMLGWK